MRTGHTENNVSLCERLNGIRRTGHTENNVSLCKRLNGIMRTGQQCIFMRETEQNYENRPYREQCFFMRETERNYENRPYRNNISLCERLNGIMRTGHTENKVSL